MASYSNNEVTTIKVGKLNEERNNDYFDAKSYIQKYENLVLKGFNQIIDNGENPNLKEAFDYAIKHPCPTFYNSITKSCIEFDCPEEGLKNGTCKLLDNKYKDRILKVYWFNDSNIEYIRLPSYNIDYSDKLDNKG